jgi:hypothetical protein
VEVSNGSLVQHVEIVDNDVTGQNLHAAVLQSGLIVFGEKADDSATGFYGHRIDLRKTLVEALHPEPVHADLRQFSTEGSFSCGKKLHVGGLNSHLARKWVVKDENPAPRHFNYPHIPPKLRRRGQE